MSEIEAKYFVQSFVRFLHKEIAERNFSADVVESLEVAAQCLETAYNLPVDEAITGNTTSNSSSSIAPDGSTAGTTAADTAEKNVLSHIDIYELFQSACSLQPDRKLEAENIKNEGNCLMREEKYQEALRAYNRAITLDPTNPVFYCNRAAAHSRLNDYQKAADDCKMSLRYDPNYGKAYGRMGIAYSKLNKHDLALKAYQQALQLEPNNVDYLNNLNVAQQRLAGKCWRFFNRQFMELVKQIFFFLPKNRNTSSWSGSRTGIDTITGRFRISGRWKCIVGQSWSVVDATRYARIVSTFLARSIHAKYGQHFYRW